MDASLRAVEETATEFLVRGEAMLAIADLSQAIDTSPDEGRLWELLGIGQWQVGDPLGAVGSLETAMTLVPMRVEASLALALAYEVVQKRSLAKNLLVDLADRDQLPLNLMEPLARALGRFNEPAKALSICQRAAENQPGEVAPLLGIVFYLGRLGAPAKSILPPLFHALSLSPEDFSIRMLAARSLFDCGLAEDAAEVLRAGDYLESGCPSCLHVMQQIFEAANEVEAAVEVVKRLAEIAEDRSTS